MAALYPLAYRDLWNHASVIEAIAAIAHSLGFVYDGSQSDFHQDDAERIVTGMIREHNVTNATAVLRLHSLRPSLCESYSRLEHRWVLDEHEIALVICESNVIPFAAPDVRDSGNIWFACGWVDFAMPDRVIERLNIDSHMASAPCLFWSE